MKKGIACCAAALLLAPLITLTTPALDSSSPASTAGNTASTAVKKCPEVYFGDSDNYQPLLDNPNDWQYVRQNIDGIYLNFIDIGFNGYWTSDELTKLCNMVTNKNAYIESDMGYGKGNEEAYIDKMQGAGFKVPYTSLNYGWALDRQNLLKTYNLLPGQSPRLCFVQQGPWAIGGDITKNPSGQTANYTNADYRSWINQADGDSTDGPLGLWYANAGGMRAGSYSMVKYAHSLGKEAVVMLCPYGASVSGFDNSKFLSVGESCVQGHEDNDAEPEIWDVFEYATAIDTTPEATNGVPNDNVTGMAYYLLKHLKGDPNTLDLCATSDDGTVTGKNVFNTDAAASKQTVSFKAKAGTTTHYSVNAADLSSWCDYAGVLKADVSGSSSAYTLQLKSGDTDITDSVLHGGYEFYKTQRLKPQTSQTVDVYITPKESATDADTLSVNLQLLPHNGSDAMDALQLDASAEATAPSSAVTSSSPAGTSSTSVSSSAPAVSSQASSAASSAVSTAVSSSVSSAVPSTTGSSMSSDSTPAGNTVFGTDSTAPAQAASAAAGGNTEKSPNTGSSTPVVPFAAAALAAGAVLVLLKRLKHR